MKEAFATRERLGRNGKTSTESSGETLAADQQLENQNSDCKAAEIKLEDERAERDLRASEERFKMLFEYAPDAYFLYDLKGNLIDSNKAAIEIIGYEKKELIGKNILSLKILPAKQIPKAGASFAKNAIGLSTGPDEFNLIHKNGTKATVEVKTFPVTIDGRAMVLGIARDITERKKMEEELKRSYERLQRALEETVHALASLVELRDPYISGHQQRVSKLASAIAKEMRLPDEKVKGIKMAGLIHDVGKINIPQEILSKPGELNKLERVVMRLHSQAGHDILETIDFPWPVAQIVLQHHERMDGSGYPAGLSGEDILIEARILAVADVVESMTCDRPYRPARSLDEALDEIAENKDTFFDRRVVTVCRRLFLSKGFELN